MEGAGLGGVDLEAADGAICGDPIMCSCLRCDSDFTVDPPSMSPTPTGVGLEVVANLEVRARFGTCDADAVDLTEVSIEGMVLATDVDSAPLAAVEEADLGSFRATSGRGNPAD